jgi:hypothetical protein
MVLSAATKTSLGKEIACKLKEPLEKEAVSTNESVLPAGTAEIWATHTALYIGSYKPINAVLCGTFFSECAYSKVSLSCSDAEHTSDSDSRSHITVFCYDDKGEVIRSVHLPTGNKQRIGMVQHQQEHLLCVGQLDMLESSNLCCVWCC